MNSKYSGGNWRPNSEPIPWRAWLCVAGVLALCYVLCVLGRTLDYRAEQAHVVARR